MRRSASLYGLVLRAAMLGLLWWGAQASTVMGQEPEGKGEPVVFPRGVPVTLLDGKPNVTPGDGSQGRPHASPPAEGLDAVSTKAEGGLSSEAGVLEEQARQTKPLDEGENLLKAAGARPSPSSMSSG